MQGCDEITDGDYGDVVCTGARGGIFRPRRKVFIAADGINGVVDEEQTWPNRSQRANQ